MDHIMSLEKLKEFFAKYRFVALILLIGIALMLLPERTPKGDAEKTVTSELTKSETQEDLLEEILEQIQGAGEVRVMLSVAVGEEFLYQTDTESNETESNRQYRADTVITSDGNRQESGLIRQVNPPVYQGAIVVCQGGDSAAVRLAVTEAVSKITGLGADHIVVLKMK